MRSSDILSSASAVLLLSSLASANHKLHQHVHALHKRHHEHLARSTPENAEIGVEIRAASPETASPEVAKRDGQCQFPYGTGLVPVAPSGMNAGWAMSPDEPCEPGNYCPYACPPGQVMAQWDPTATSYTYPKSMNGGLFCDENGQISKPFPEKPYCVQTQGNIGVTNEAGGVVSFCQTVLPGNEAMLIPTEVYGTATLANPGTDYWCQTAAHFYINPPGVNAAEACVWGSNARDVGNWSPYVAGTNTDDNGQTFIKLGWNPIYLEPTTPFRNQMPDWGVKIDCPDGKCNGLPCEINPVDNFVNQMKGSRSNGAGGGAFCVVTVPKGSTANFVVFGGSSGGSGGHGGQFYGQSSQWSDAAMSSTTGVTSTSAAASSSTWSSSSNYTASSTTSAPQSSKHPNKDLFATDTSAEVTSTLTTPIEVTSATRAASPNVTPASATGGASQRQWSTTGFAISLLAAIFLI